MISPERLTAFLEQQLPAALDLLRRMVEINSYTGNKAGVNRLARFTADAFAPFGFAARFVPSVNPDCGDHLILTRPGKSGRAVAMVTHLDTVFPPEEEVQNQFFWRIEGDRIYGPGTNDIKGGTVVIYQVVAALQALAPEVFEDITWIILADATEETLSFDFGQLCVETMGANTLAALVFESGLNEPGSFNVVTARKGRTVFTVQVEGRGAHAGGRHPQGANAIRQLARTIEAIESMTDYAKQLTFNVGTVAGGTGLNRVPHQAMAQGEMRAFDLGVFRKAQADLLALSQQATVRAAADGHPCRVSLEIISESSPWSRNPGTEMLFGLYGEAARALGCQIVAEERGGLSDGNFLWQAVPTLDGLGPFGLNDHCSERTPDGSKDQEYVNRSAFVPKAALSTLAILKLAARAQTVL